MYNSNVFICYLGGYISLNYLEIDQILEELDLNNSLLQNVKAIDYESFTFFFYKPGLATNVLISMDSNCRIHRSSIKKKYMGKPHNLVEYLKAYIIGGRVTSIKQIDLNRIIEISILKDNKIFFIIIRLWGGFPNIIITKENYTIIHLHRKSSKKEELPGLIFKYPEKRQNNKSYELHKHSYTDYNSFIESEYSKIIEQSKIDLKKKKRERDRERRLKEIAIQIKKLNRRLKSYNDADNYKLQGDLILSNIHLIKKGDRTLKTINYNTGEPIEIVLNPELRTEQNSNLYYKKYQKSIHGIEITKDILKQLKNEKDLLEKNLLELNIPKQEIKKTLNTKIEKPGLHYKSGSWEIIVGTNAKENENLLRHWVKGNDMWLHIRDYPGGYVFVKSQKNRTIPLEILKDAGTLALFYSKGKNNGKADITYTHVKYLRRVKNGKPGQVIPSMDKTLYIVLDKKRLESIKP